MSLRYPSHTGESPSGFSARERQGVNLTKIPESHNVMIRKTVFSQINEKKMDYSTGKNFVP
jgi:hypothetical protein